MTPDPTRWAVLGQAMRNDRERQGLTREQLAARVRERGGQVTPRSIGNLEAGIVPKKRAKPSTLEPVVAALGWKPGWTDRILVGEDPNAVVQHGQAGLPAEAPAESPRAQLLELAPRVYEFSRIAARLGAPAQLRDEFDQLVQQLLDSVPAGRAAREVYGLAAYRPHAEGEGVPVDDAARIREALNGNT
jgi:transcriptional regulator with XRE-family HTH domain